ncbi:hypothetical protein BDV96DRAFT_653752 [Lophiotrema nucula]|uniref:Protein NO VEIN C-terminal domain-containing protein n=1 Tax=Lophiotrema nucula TaxID=690887 RepID=A0A6A5YJX4_9PLEO|nr:hypothetical protein BDV96DRAFT_653752 [Lophiotrema nucula]
MFWRGFGDREPSSEFEAQAILKSIRAEKGYLDNETMKDLDLIRDRSRQNILRIVELKKETKAAYTKSISEQLYSSKYRFLYELIQNADDSLFSNLDEHTPPTMEIRLGRSTIVIDTNEDGFTRANVEAICATGKSSKKASASDDHIGEKGFGFKAVFSVAEKVHVQSGWWSFAFEHRRGDNGLGMVTPLEAPREILPDTMKTRITLTLSDDSDNAYDRLVRAAKDIPDTTIFFLQRLRLIRMEVQQPDESYERIAISKKKQPTTKIVSIHRSSSQYQDGEETLFSNESRDYYVFEHTVCDMPKDERRKDRIRAKVELAFPVDSKKREPILSNLGQHVFAYLPLRRLNQIQFLIQSDFITSASRESVIDCPWNDKVRDGIAITFARAVATFATEDHPLRYRWFDYLPMSPLEGLWQPLLEKILNLLRDMPILQTWTSGTFKKPSDLFRLKVCALHNGNPLLEDLEDEEYLSSSYDAVDSWILERLGIRNLRISQFMDRLQADLEKSSSRLRNYPQTDPWHESFAKLGLRCFRRWSYSYHLRMKKLAIVPLEGGSRWTGAPSIGNGSLNEIYFPSQEGVDIPDDISLNLVDRIAATSAIRKEFFEAMGVQECSTEKVIAHIEARHKHETRPYGSNAEDISCSQALSHFHYLYHYHTTPASLKPWILVPTEDGILRTTSSPLFFPSDQEYDTQELLWKIPPDETVAEFLLEDLVDLEAPDLLCNKMSWKKWLQDATGARYHPPLLMDDEVLSSCVLAVCKHNPSKFVGMLHAHWDEYSQDVQSVDWYLELSRVPVRSGKLFQLNSTYLPTLEIVQRLRELGMASRFPLLALPVDLNDSNLRHWQFLEEIGVHSKLDLHFYVQVLRRIKRNDKKYNSNTQEVIRAVYESLAKLIQIDQMQELGESFNLYELVGLPETGSYRPVWISPDECVWRGPDFMKTKCVLETHFANNEALKTFFTFFLKIRDYELGDLFCEIEKIRNDDSLSASAKMNGARKVYHFLSDSVQQNEEWAKIKHRFSIRKLITSDGIEWFSSTFCLWGSPFPLSGYVELSRDMPNLEQFFVKRLKVKTATPSMLVSEITKMAKDAEPRIEDMRQRLIEIGMMTAKNGIDSKLSQALDLLKELSFLPMKLDDGASTLLCLSDDFAILDHARYADAFASKNIFLDFTLDEVQILDTLFRHLGLASRYLSRSVKERSIVGEGAIRDDSLGEDLQAKAYALYCCAAKYKSIKALRGERQLFHLLSEVQILTTDNISTELLISFTSSTVTVHSDRQCIHHELLEEHLKIYVPKDSRQCKACYRSQMPALVSYILGLSPREAAFPVALILKSDLYALDDILSEQDIPFVSWIPRPIINLPPEEETRPVSPASTEATAVEGLRTPMTPQGATRSPRNSEPLTPPPSDHYERLLGQVIRSAERSGRRASAASRAASFSPSPSPRTFDHTATFGNRDQNQFAHDRKIGAAGETYVFEILSRLSLPNFSRANWKSTIRNEARAHSRYADMDPWMGAETADIVYLDRQGILTQWLKANTGVFPDWLNCEVEVEYYIEVKTTTSACDTRFFLSSGQHRRMKDIDSRLGKEPLQVYVICRVYNITSPDVGMKILVEPGELPEDEVTFEVHNWVGRTQ